VTKQEELYDKCTAELDAFVENLKTKTRDEILVLADEKAFREEITEALNSDDFLSEEEAGALLALDKPLEALYDGWTDAEETREDTIRDVIWITADRVKDDVELYAGKYANIEPAPIQATDKPPSAQAINGVQDLEAELIARVERNYADFKQSLDVFSRGELVEMAATIHAYSDAWSYMTSYHAFSDEEIEFYLQFSNPLEIVGDAWRERNIDLEDVSYTMDFVYEQKDQHLAQYALMTDAPLSHDNDLRRFVDVDVLSFLGKIAEKTLITQPNDWQLDRETLYRATSSDDLNDRRLVWHVCSSGTHLEPERNVFVSGTWAYSCMTNYRDTDPDMFGYVVEVTGRGEKGEVIGNVYEVGDYSEYAKHIRDEALPYKTVTLTYSDEWGVNAGRVMTVKRVDFDRNSQDLLKLSGEVISARYNPAYESQLQDVLRAERNTRMSYPIGSPEAHLQKLTAKLAEIRKPPEQEKPAPVKEKSAFDKALSRGKEKSDAYKAQKAGEPAADKKKHEERS
jgi:hypothetical protein